MANYTEHDTPESLTEDQLKLLSESRPDWVLDYLSENTIFDIHSIRLLLEIGKNEAKKMLLERNKHKIASQPVNPVEQKTDEN